VFKNAPAHRLTFLGWLRFARARYKNRSMGLADEFPAAQARVLELARPPTTDEMLELYALYKQATVGDAAPGKRPGMLDFKGRAKYDAWVERKGMSAEAAMQSYVDLVAALANKYG
jgi:acyl-CoA-binding protein